MQKPDILRLTRLLNRPDSANHHRRSSQPDFLQHSERRRFTWCKTLIYTPERNISNEEWYSLTPEVDLQLPDHLVEKIEIAAKALSKSRTEIVDNALRQYLQEFEGDEEVKEEVVELYLHDEIGFDLLKQIIGQQDAESAREAKALLEQGEDLVDGLTDILPD